MPDQSQPELFRSRTPAPSGPPSDDDLPADVQAALDVITGAAVPGDGSLEQVMSGLNGTENNQQAKSTGMIGDMIRTGMMKNSDRVDKFQRLEEPKVRVFDIAKEEDQIELEKIYVLAGDPTNRVMLSESPPQIILNPACSRGYHVIVVVKYWRTVNDARLQAPPGR